MIRTGDAFYHPTFGFGVVVGVVGSVGLILMQNGARGSLTEESLLQCVAFLKVYAEEIPCEPERVD